MGQNRVEKIVQRACTGLSSGESIHAGDYVHIHPHHVMTHDNSGAVIPKFTALGANKIHDPAQPVFALDHDVQNTSETNLAKYRRIEAFAHKHGLSFFAAGRGIGHQLMIDEGFVQPGQLVVASDSHSNIYGALAALGTPVVRSDAAAIWATGETWWQVPPVVKLVLNRELPKRASGKDLIMALAGLFNHDEVLNSVLEIDGPGLASLSMDARMAVANMSTEWGCLGAVFACDTRTRAYLRQRMAILSERDAPYARRNIEALGRSLADTLLPDEDARYTASIEVDLSTLPSLIAGPNTVKKTRAVDNIGAQEIRVDRAYLLSCVGGRKEDLAAAAQVLRGKKIADHVKLYIAAASEEIEQRARNEGDWQVLLEAGAIALPPGCGPCIGLGEGLLQAGEVGISATNRNFKGRMGSRDAQVFLASPAVVAASAVAGYVCSAQPGSGGPLAATLRQHPSSPRSTATTIVPNFEPRQSGRLLWLNRDNLDTDGIYGKEFTYQDDMTPQQMAAVCMRNYDPFFQDKAQRGDIVVGGSNFGCGSSREQAATALMHRGLRAIIAASFSQTYQRNALNNGFVLIECPDLVDHLRQKYAAHNSATVVTDLHAHIDFANSQIDVDDQSFAFAPLGPAAQELIVSGGLAARVRQALGA